MSSKLRLPSPVILLALSAALALAACGGSEGDAGDDVETYLIALRASADDIAEDIDALSSAGLAPDVASARSNLQAALDALDAFAADLAALGPPDDVAEAHARLVAAVDAYAELFRTALDRLGDEIDHRDALSVPLDLHEQLAQALLAFGDDARIDIGDIHDLLTTIADRPDGDDNGNGGDGDLARPPSLLATHDGISVPAGTGSYCWTDPAAGAGLCADAVGVITGFPILRVGAGGIVTLSGELDWATVGVANAQAHRTTLPIGSPEPGEGGPGWLAWAPSDRSVPVAVTVEPDGISFVAPTVPGSYAVNIFVRVPQGDVSYGVWIEVVHDGATPPDTVAVVLGEDFAIGVGGTVTLEDAPLTLRFEEISEDSRCPIDAVCVWAGQAVAEFSATLAGVTSPLRIVIEGTGSALLGPYRLDVLLLTPAPQSGEPLGHGDYVLVGAVTLSDGGGGSDGVLTARSCDEQFPGGIARGDVVDAPFVCIDRPGIGAAVSGELTVSGHSAGAFEASIVVQVRSDRGDVLDFVPVQVDQPEIGLFAGHWDATLTIPDVVGAGVIEAFTVSAQDGSIAFGAVVPVRLVVASDYEQVEVLAPIDVVEINVAESFPPQYFVHVESGLPSGCTLFSRLEVERTGTLIEITVWNLGPAPDSDIACTAIYGIVENNVALGIDFEPGETYTVRANDVETSFIAQ